MYCPSKIKKIDRDSFPVQSSQSFWLDQNIRAFLSTRRATRCFGMLVKVTEQSILQLKIWTWMIALAILAFSGIQYHYMAPDILPRRLIISKICAFFPVLQDAQAVDGVCPIAGIKHQDDQLSWLQSLPLFRAMTLLIVCLKEYSNQFASKRICAWSNHI